MFDYVLFKDGSWNLASPDKSLYYSTLKGLFSNCKGVIVLRNQQQSFDYQFFDNCKVMNAYGYQPPRQVYDRIEANSSHLIEHLSDV